MFARLRPVVASASAGLALLVSASPASAKPTAEQALELAPVQGDVPYQRLSKEEAAKCVVESAANGEGAALRGWVVRDASGTVLRRFLDTNKDEKLDLWCYYRDGIEVYRDVDSNFNGKADEYRWLGTAGTRWGLDRDEDGRIDSWKRISPEEVTFEVVAALRERDAQRFSRLLLTAEELGELGLDETHTAELKQKLDSAKSGFGDLARKQKFITDKTQWTNFGATQPGVLATGVESSAKDLVVYENVAAVIETDGKNAQLPVGTLVQIGANWRLIDLPTPAADDKTASGPSGYFFTTLAAAPLRTQENTVTPEFQKLADAYDRKQRDLQKATNPEDLARLNRECADLLEQLFKTSSGEADRDNWLRQLADTISAAVQTGHYGEGVERLESLAKSLAESDAKPSYVSYVKFRHIMAEYGRDVQDPDLNFSKINSKWIERLEKFVDEFPKSDDTADALMQLAIALEVGERPEDAARRYQQIATEFASEPVAKKAAGARRRLESLGQTLKLASTTLDGKAFDLSSLRGYTVVIHYWSTNCEPCKEDMTQLRAIQDKYAKQKLAIVGINLDTNAKVAAEYVRKSRLNWTHLHEPGGTDSRLATELGIFSLPMMLLVNKEGQLVQGNLHAAELDGELSKIFRERAANSKTGAGNASRK